MFLEVKVQQVIGSHASFLCIDAAFLEEFIKQMLHFFASMLIIKQKEHEQYQKQQRFQLHHWQNTLKKDELETQQTILV
jgi:hypothetical protein